MIPIPTPQQLGIKLPTTKTPVVPAVPIPTPAQLGIAITPTKPAPKAVVTTLPVTSKAASYATKSNDELSRKRIEAIIYAEASNDEKSIRDVASTIVNRQKAHPTESLYNVATAPGQYAALASKEYRKYLQGDLAGMGEKEKATLVKKVSNEIYSGQFKDTTGGLIAYTHDLKSGTFNPDYSVKQFPYGDPSKNPANKPTTTKPTPVPLPTKSMSGIMDASSVGLAGVKKNLGMVKDIAQSTLRSFASAGVSVANKLNPSGPTTVNPKDLGKVGTALFGEKPIGGISQTGKEFLQSFGASEDVANKWAFPAGALVVGLDILPPGIDDAFMKIAKLKNAERIASVLSKELKIPAEVIPELSKTLVGVTDRKVVKQIIELEAKKAAGVVDLKTEIKTMEEYLKNDPARKLSKYANANGELPEVIGGTSVGGRTGATSKFGKYGDTFVTELGFADSEEARAAYQAYRDSKMRLDNLKNQLKTTPTTKGISKEEWIKGQPRTYKGVEYTNISNNATKADFAVDKNNTGWITNLETKPEFRNKGEATKLIKEGLTFLKEKGVNEVRAVPENEISKKLFEKFGFKSSGKEYVLTSSQLSSLYDEAAKAQGQLGKLDPLAVEARKYKSVEEFRASLQKQLDETGHNPITGGDYLYHVSEQPNLTSIDGAKSRNGTTYAYGNAPSGDRSGTVYMINKSKIPPENITVRGGEYHIKGTIPSDAFINLGVKGNKPFDVTTAFYNRAKSQLSSLYDEATKATPKTTKMAKPATAVVERVYKDLSTLPTVSKTAKEEMPGMIRSILAKINPANTKLGEVTKDLLKPTGSIDSQAKLIYDEWTANIIKAKLAGQEILAKTSSLGKTSLKTILDYEKGATGPMNDFIRKSFDSLYKAAKDAGIQVEHIENYVPQVYRNKADEVMNAVGNYLKDQGVDLATVKGYLTGDKDLPGDVAARLKLNPSFAKQRAFPNYATAMRYGLKPKYETIPQLLAHYQEELARAVANRNFLQKLAEEGHLMSGSVAPQSWKAVNLPFGNERLFAEPKFAKLINGLFNDTPTFSGEIVKGISFLSRRMQELALSAGVPGTNINFFTIGQVIKEMASGNLKSVVAFVRSNFNGPSRQFFLENIPTMKKMAEYGIDLGDHVGSLGDAYKSLSLNRGLGKILGETFDKAFNKKTFASFMPQMYIQIFKDAERVAASKGLAGSSASEFAANVVKKSFGLMENVGRSKTTQDTISSIFFAPKFRESLVNVIMNSAKSVTTRIFDPTFYRNRRLVAGVAVMYGVYNYVNKQLTGKYMWENEPGKGGDLKIPLHPETFKNLPELVRKGLNLPTEEGQYIYLGFMPSFLAFPRNLLSGGYALATGDYTTAKQKLGSLFSMPLKMTAELWANSDYFGRPIWKPTDSKDTVTLKVAEYMGLQYNHPYVSEFIRQMWTQKDKPMYQSLSQALELPLKFSSWDKASQAQFYKALDEQAKIRARNREQVQPKYDQIKQLLMKGDVAGAKAIYDAMNPLEQSIFKDIKTSDTAAQTFKTKTAFYSTYLEIKALLQDGQVDDARKIYDAMTEAERKAFESLKNADIKGQPIETED